MKTFLVTKGMVPAQLPCSTDDSYPEAVLESVGDMAPQYCKHRVTFPEQLHGREALERYYQKRLADNGMRSEAKKQLVPTYPIRYATIRFWSIQNIKKV